MAEGAGFEPSVPRVMDGDLGGQVPALIAVLEPRLRPFNEVVPWEVKRICRRRFIGIPFDLCAA